MSIHKFGQALLSCLISSEMFREFVMPALVEQCERLAYVMYHLDGTTALHQLDALLEIKSIRAIEWTPQAGIEGVLPVKLPVNG